MYKCKLKDLKISTHKVNINKNFNKLNICCKNAYRGVNINECAWLYYLNNNDDSKIKELISLYQKCDKYPDNYSYDLSHFNKLLNSMIIFGYNNIFEKSNKFRIKFQDDNWPGGNGPVKIYRDEDGNFHIGDGHHRCSILYYLFGPEKYIYIKDQTLINLDKPSNMQLIINCLDILKQKKKNICALESKCGQDDNCSTNEYLKNIENGELLSINNKFISYKSKLTVNIKFKNGLSINILDELEKDYYDIIYLDSINNMNHIFEEFKISLKLISLGGFIIVNNLGLDVNLNIQDMLNKESEKGITIFMNLKKYNLLNYLKFYKTLNGYQGYIHITDNKIKNLKF